MSANISLPGRLPELLTTYTPILVPFRTSTGVAGMPGAVVGVVGKQIRVCVVGKVLLYNPEELYLNLSTPEGVCRATRWLAERLGFTVKNWAVFEEDTRRERFRLKQYVLRVDGMTVAFFADSTLKNGGWGRAMFFVDGLGAAESYADAIRMTCLSVGGAS